LCCVIFDEFETMKHPLSWLYVMPCVKHILKNIKIINENNIWAIQISIIMFNSQPALRLQVHKNKSGKYPNSCKLLHLHIPIHIIFYKLYSTCSTHVICMSLHSARYQVHGWKCWREIWGRNFELKQEEMFQMCVHFFLWYLNKY
jgi:hypothetical protein